MAVDKVSVPAGRPANCVYSDLDSLKTRSLHEISKFDAKVVNNLGKLYALYEDMAFAKGDFKNATPQVRRGAIEALILRGELYAKEEGMAQEAVNSILGSEDLEEEEFIEEKKVANGGTVVSEMTFSEKKEEFRRKQEEKLAKE